MVLYQLDLARIIQVYVVQGVVGIFFLFIAYKILKRKKSRLNLTFSGLYISIAIGIFINFIYAPLTDETMVFILNFMTNYFIFFSMVFLLVFNLMLLKSEKKITVQKQLVITIIYGVILFCMILIPNGVTINAETGWKPVWSGPFFIYVIGVMTGIAIGPSLYFSFQIYKQLQDEIMRKKWKYFIVGIFGIFSFMYGTLLSNTLNIQAFRTVWSLISIGVVTIFPYLVYYGVGKQIEE